MEQEHTPTTGHARPAAARRRSRRASELTVRLSHEVQRAREAIEQHDLRLEMLRVELAATEALRGAAEEELRKLEDLSRRARSGQTAAPPAPGGPPPEAATGPSGARLRELAVRAALVRGAVGRPIHHTEWLEWVREDEGEPAGKKPEAVFLTQLGRSPLVRRADDPGYYCLDVTLARELAARLRALHAQVLALPAPDQLSMLGDARARRRELEAEISRVERLAEEAWRMLALEQPPGFADGAEADADVVVRAWLGEPAAGPYGREPGLADRGDANGGL